MLPRNRKVLSRVLPSLPAVQWVTARWVTVLAVNAETDSAAIVTVLIMATTVRIADLVLKEAAALTADLVKAGTMTVRTEALQVPEHVLKERKEILLNRAKRL